MGFAIELYFDEESDKRVRQLWQALAEGGITSRMVDIEARPHISLAVLEKGRPSTIEQGIADFARHIEPFSLQLSSVGSFPTAEGVVFLAPVVTGSLLAVHDQFHDWLLKAGLVSLDYYLPGNWVPHCTVAINLDQAQIGPTAAFCQQFAGVYGRVHIESVGLVSFPPIVPLATFPLSKAP